MKKTIALLSLLFVFGLSQAQDLANKRQSPIFEIGENDFLLNGKPFVIRCGEIHFARIPKEYWIHRLKMAKAMGLNTVCAYLFWNMHEPQPGKFDWSGMADAATFCKLAQNEGLFVILRPGPYSCAEWEFGGFPWWLLKNKNLKLRTRDPYYLKRCRIYLNQVGKVLAPLQITNGGPIIMTQVENEYGSYGSDKKYIGKIRDYLVEAGFSVPLFTCDGPSQLKNDARDDIFSVVNFGDNPEYSFKELRKIRLKGPLMCGEYYPGWFDSWGKKHHIGSTENVVKEIGYMLENKASFSIYMVHGGTTFGQWSGSNSPPFSPQTSSYDYDAPISEAGWETDKFHALRTLFSNYLQENETLPAVPARNPVIQIPIFSTTEIAPLFSNLPAFVNEKKVKNMEEFNQGYGSILYRTKLSKGLSTTLIIEDIHDFALIFINGKKIATIDRRKNETSCVLPNTKDGDVLDILVEAMGRINYGPGMHDRKGITDKVLIKNTNGDYRELVNWQVYPIELGNNTAPEYLKFEIGNTNMPSYHKGSFSIDNIGDTFLDVSSWGKGLVWINGHCLGRFWNIGPTQTMYVPAPWLKKGINEIIILDYIGPTKNTLSGLEFPQLDGIVQNTKSEKHRKENQILQLAESTAFSQGVFKDGIEWQTVTFEKTRGRYFCFEATSSQKENDPDTAIAELYLLDTNGKEIPRNKWKVVYADSEEVDSDDGKADNVFDLQSTSVWRTQKEAKSLKHPHQLVIDLGSVVNITGLKYLPCQDDLNGKVKGFKLYISKKGFSGL
jgi:beta-galactosidase